LRHACGVARHASCLAVSHRSRATRFRAAPELLKREQRMTVASRVGKTKTCEHDLIPTLDQVLTMDPDAFVAQYTDIAAVNLACARGLPHVVESEFPEYLALLDEIADAVKRETERNWRLFKQKSAQFENSEVVYRLYTMEHVIRVQFQIRYDSLVQKIIEEGKAWKSDDSREIFIHGILGSKKTGTCSSLPVFAVAVGRRLGYPLKFVLAPNHGFYRWDDGTELWNMQHNEGGGVVVPTEYFYEWPRKWRGWDHELNERTRVWLHSMTPKQEVSKFLCNRAIFLRDIGRLEEALLAIDVAGRFNPTNPTWPDIRGSILSMMPAQRALFADFCERILQSKRKRPAPAMSLRPLPAPIPFGPTPTNPDAVRLTVLSQVAMMIRVGGNPGQSQWLPFQSNSHSTDRNRMTESE
jgi:hypothetical protein